jgi:hypothetical protein
MKKPDMENRIVLLRGIKQDWKAWSEGKRLGCISKKLADTTGCGGRYLRYHSAEL